MRHRVAGRTFNRDTNARKALFIGLAKNLIEKEQIKTTLPKAKDLFFFNQVFRQTYKQGFACICIAIKSATSFHMSHLTTPFVVSALRYYRDFFSRHHNQKFLSESWIFCFLTNTPSRVRK